MSQMIKISALSALLGLTGCSVMEPVSMEAQSSLQLMPYSQTLALNGDSKHLAHSKNELAKFIDELTPQTLKHPVTLSLYSGEGVMLQGFARQYLLEAGVPASKIQSQDLSMHYDPSRDYDFTLKVVKYKVAMSECQPTRVEKFYRTGNGCFIEAARMSSLVNAQTKQAFSSDQLND